MSGFFRKFLREDPRRLDVPADRQIFLAAFGKHPGWDDHIPGVGFETESLLTAKTLLYVEGIGGQFAVGAWAKLEPEQRLDFFDHWWLWLRDDQFILGRLWSSSDSKGRKLYPMVVCAHCLGCPLPWALAQVLPKLEEVRHRCVATEAAADVELILKNAQKDLRAEVKRMDPDVGTIPAVDHGQFLDSPDWDSQHEGLLRILHKIQSDLGSYAIGQRLVDTETAFTPPPGAANRGTVQGLRPQSIRVPACGSSAAEILLQWRDFFCSQLDPHAPLLFALPPQHGWLDVLVGKPTSHELFALLATPKVLPLASEVPYVLDDSFRETENRFIQQYRHHQPPNRLFVRKLLRFCLAVLLPLLFFVLIACYLRYAPGRSIPGFLRSPARLIGNPLLPTP